MANENGHFHTDIHAFTLSPRGENQSHQSPYSPLAYTHLCSAKMPPYTCGPTLFTSFSSRLKNGYRVGYFRHRGRDSLLGMGEETMKELLTLVMAQTATQSETTTQANVWRNKPLSHSILNLLQYFRLFLYV